MKKFDKMIQTLLEAKNLMECFRTHGNLGVCIRDFITCVKKAPAQDDDTHFILMISFAYDSRWGFTAGAANMTIHSCNNHEQNSSSKSSIPYREAMHMLNKYCTKMMQTKNIQEFLIALQQRINQFKEASVDDNFKVFLFNKIEHTLNLFVDSQFVKPHSNGVAYTYNLYNSNDRDVDFVITVDVVLPSALSTAKELSQDDTDDISNW